MKLLVNETTHLKGRLSLFFIITVISILSQHHKVYAVDIVPEKVDMVNQRKSPIQDEYIEKNLAEKDLDLTAMLDTEMAYSAV